MVVHIQGGKGGQDRDVMLSPVLLDKLRAHWRCLRKKSVWLFPGNRWHSGDHPTNDKTPYHACVEAPAAPGLRNESIPTCSATASPPTYSKPAPTCTLSRFC
jgi:integrase/recombinase XerD